MVDQSVNPAPSSKSSTAKSANHRQAPPPPPQRRVASQAKPPTFDTSVEQLVVTAIEKKASDIHIRVGHKPRIRIRGEMVELSQELLTTSEIFDQYLREIIPAAQRKKFREEKELDTAIFYPDLVRCRVNCFDSLSGGAMVLRLISLDIPSIDNLRLPQVIKKIVQAPQGLILITGPTGSGKSTTMAAAIDHLNRNFHKHIVTIEDPIEFVHTSQKCLISQREVGLHTLEFHQALRAVLREDPDVILVGEMRDRITINTALQAAQTGHLVMGTLHTRNAIDSVNRLVNLYPPDEQQIIRIQLVESLVAVVAQQLLPTTDRQRVAVHDILINTPTMKDYLIRGEEDEAFHLMKTEQIEGMQVLNQALYREILDGRITIEDAHAISPDPGELERLMRTGGYDASSSPRDWQG
ncbi:type IV pilus twitching motility protein PilT [Sodalinema gerasimenkoae]|uniref:type IV pilus twitching motility protein PilT n=1 Tax=Sodalinema gerasimenkoae TaxID=2862348 RepID=UPI00135C9202|nr:type IV pilus twitching motility protein PilT [Sodalinema gerasimenkoae]